MLTDFWHRLNQPIHELSTEAVACSEDTLNAQQLKHSKPGRIVDRVLFQNGLFAYSDVDVR